MPNWSSFPPEIRSVILKLLAHHDNKAAYAVVSAEWRCIMESKNFRHLRLSPSCLDMLDRLSDRQKGLIEHVWLNIELKRYTCRVCRKMESVTWFWANDKIIATAITKLFLILAGWNPSWRPAGKGLTLELNAYSPSDSEHWFPKCYFGAPGEENLLLKSDQPGYIPTATTIHDPGHGWWQGRMIEAPGDNALRRPFELATLKFDQDLPLVQVVTRFLLRRQCRRQLDPSTISYLWSKLPRLRHIAYEPWQLQEKVSQDPWDRGYQKMINLIPAGVTTITVFEDFNENYLDLFQLLRSPFSNLNPDRVRITARAVSAAFAAKSRQLEHLSVGFMADADHFFQACQREWQWHHLRSLTLTSRIMSKNNPLQTNRLLEAAARCALEMPKLETMTLWNGARREACAFIFCRENASVTWRGTWNLKFESSLVDAWKKVAYKYSRHEFQQRSELMGYQVRSHGDAIYYLGLPSVVDCVSLKQIRRENYS